MILEHPKLTPEHFYLGTFQAVSGTKKFLCAACGYCVPRQVPSYNPPLLRDQTKSTGVQDCYHYRQEKAINYLTQKCLLYTQTFVPNRQNVNFYGSVDTVELMCSKTFVLMPLSECFFGLLRVLSCVADMISVFLFRPASTRRLISLLLKQSKLKLSP